MTYMSWELDCKSTRLILIKLFHFLVDSILLFFIVALFSVAGMVSATEENPLTLAPLNCDDFELTQIYVNEEQLSVNAVRVGKYFWSHSMDSYYVNGRLLLPVAQIADIISMALDRNGDKIEFQHPDAACSFDVTLQERPFGNGTIPKNSEKGFWTQDEFDTYVDMRFLEQLVGEKADVNLAKQLVTLNTDTELEPIAVQKATPKNPIFTVYPEYHIADQYHLSTFPSVDLNLSYDLDNDTSSGNYNARLNAYFDTFFHATELRFNQNSTDRSQRLKFSREFRLGAQQQSISKAGYEFGDIFTASDNLITSSNLGRGVYLYAGGRDQFNAFNDISIQETVPPNWRGELYRNGQFITEQQANNENQLIFDAVPAFFGLNRYELRLFGPDGQQEIRFKTYQKGKDQLVENKLNVELYHLNPGNNFIDDNSQTQSLEQASKLGLSYGVNQDLTIGLALQSLQKSDSEGNDQYITASFHKQHDPGAFNLEVSAQKDKGFALFGGYSGYWKEQYNVSLDVRHYHDFTSQVRPNSADVRSQIQGRIVGASDWWGRVGWRASITKQFNPSTEDNLRALFSATKNIRNGALSANFNYNQKNGFDRISNNLFWAQNFKFGKVSIGLNWLPFNNFDINNSYVEARWQKQDKLVQISRLTHQPNKKAQYSLNHRLNWRSQHFTLSSGVTVNDRGDWELAAGFVTNIGYDYVRSAPRFYQKQSSNSGNLHLLAFLDRDRDGLLSDGDASLQNVKFAGNNSWNFTKTNEYGQALLMGASVSGAQHIGIDLVSLEDPFLSPQYEKLSVKTHPGGLNRIMIPVVQHSDLEGFVYIEESTGIRPALNIPVLLKYNDEVIANTLTESDGYFAFSKISPGSYKVAIDQDYLVDRRILLFDEELSLTVGETGDVIWLDDIILKRAGEQSAEKVTKVLPEQIPQKVSTNYPSPITLNSEGYWLQLGAFQQLASLNQLLELIPKMDNSSLHKIQSATGVWYLVSGTSHQQAFETRSEALSALQSVQQNPLLSHAWVVPATKFNGAMTQQAVKKSVEEVEVPKVETDAIANASQPPQMGEYVCQLGVYRDFRQLNPLAVQQFYRDKNARLVDRIINGQPLQVALLTFSKPVVAVESDSALSLYNQQKAWCENKTHDLTSQAGWYRTWQN